MRNLLVLAIALRISMSDEDVINLGYDATEAEVKSYFSIPEDVVIDYEKMTSNHSQSETFSFDDVKRLMNGKEQTAYKKAFPSEFKKTAPAKEETKTTDEVKSSTDTKAEEAKAKADAKAQKDAEKEAEKKKKEEEAEKKKAEKEAAAKAKADAKAEADKAKAEAKATKDAEKAEAKKKKEEEKAAKDAEKNTPKNLSRSQMMQVYHSEGLEYAQVIQMHPTWNQAHVRNAIYYAKQNPDVVAKTLELKNKLDELGKPMNDKEIALEIPVAPAEEPQASATEENGTTEESVTNESN